MNTVITTLRLPRDLHDRLLLRQADVQKAAPHRRVTLTEVVAEAIASGLDVLAPAVEELTFSAPLSPSAPVTYTNTVGIDGRTVSSETAPVPWDAAVPAPHRFGVEEASAVVVEDASWTPVTQLRFCLPAASRVSVSASANYTGGEWECFVDGEPWTVERTDKPLPAGFHTATIVGRRGATFGSRSVRVEVVS